MRAKSNIALPIAVLIGVKKDLGAGGAVADFSGLSLGDERSKWLVLLVPACGAAVGFLRAIFPLILFRW